MCSERGCGHVCVRVGVYVCVCVCVCVCVRDVTCGHDSGVAKGGEDVCVYVYVCVMVTRLIDMTLL